MCVRFQPTHDYSATVNITGMAFNHNMLGSRGCADNQPVLGLHTYVLCRRMRDRAENSTVVVGVVHQALAAPDDELPNKPAHAVPLASARN